MIQKSLTGFTLVEILVVVGIIGVLAASVLAGLNYFSRQEELDTTAQEVLTALRLAQNRTLASEGSSNYGVYFEAGQFTLFKGGAYIPGAVDNQVHVLPSRLTFSSINILGSTALFERLTGASVNAGSVRLESVGDSSKFRVIYIDSSGSVGLAASAPTDADRETDSRHVHVAYGQNVKRSDTLRVSFSGGSVIQDIDFQTYLNSGQTEFNWEGTISVGGADQVLHIHSHGLTDSSVVFCFHRDRRLNSASLDVSLDGQNLINYSAAGALTQGTSIWAGAPEMQ